jgi:hypothetical protein
MRKPITPFAHGMIDYLTVGTVAAAPRLMDFPEEASTACYTLAALYAGTSMMTDYPLGVRRALPFKAHGFAEVAIGAMLPALPFVLGFAGNRRARNFFLGLTALTAMTAVMTDWDKQSERVARRRHKRKPRLVGRAA